MKIFIVIILVAAVVFGGLAVVRRYRKQFRKTKHQNAEIDDSLQELLSDSSYNRISQVEQESIDRMKKFLHDRI